MKKITTTKEQESIKDDLNPIYIFSITHTDLLSKAVKGEIDLNELAKQELENRGLNENGAWVGFNKKIEIGKAILKNAIKRNEVLKNAKRK